MTAAMPRPEFSHLVSVSDLAPAGATYTLAANDNERAALARRFGLLALNALSAEITLKWVPGGAFLRLNGRIRASVVQSCVVTLEPVTVELDQPVDILFDPNAESAAELDLNAEEDIEPLEDDVLDIAEIVAEEMVLMLDPYPRAPGAAPGPLGPRQEARERGDELDQGEDVPRGSPFEILAGLRRKQ